MNMLRADDHLSLIQSSWVEKYGLDKLHGEVKKVPAAILMRPTRFELFAKYYYIRNRKTSPFRAKRVYYENLRCLVPFGKEHGKEEEKNTFAKHFEVFDSLIDTFSSEEFDPSCSLVPVGADNLLFDGAHRVATLAFYKKDIWICEFASVVGDNYDYAYFTSRWMSDYAADLTAFEGMCFLKGMVVLCIWGDIQEFIPDQGIVFYQRSFTLNRREYIKLRSCVEPDWKGIGNEIVRNVKPVFVFLYSPAGLEERESGSVTIIRGEDSVRRVSSIVLTKEGRKQWRSGGCVSTFKSSLVVELSYRWYRFKKWLSVKDYKIWISFYGVVSRLWKKNYCL